MSVHRAIIFDPSKLRELARKDRLKHIPHRAQRLSNLALLGDWLGVPVRLIVADDASLNGSAGSEVADVAAPTPAAAPERVTAPRMRPDPAEPTPADWRLGPNFPEQRRKSKP